MKHNWKKNKDGNIDEYAWEYEFHSGVVCEDCGRCVCTMCNPNYIELDDCTGKPDNNKAKIIPKEKLLEYNKPIWIECIGDKCDLNISFEDWGFIEGLNYFDKNRIDLYWIGNDVPDHPFLKDYGKTWIAYTDRPE